jgi:hypothetical protein
MMVVLIVVSKSIENIICLNYNSNLSQDCYERSGSDQVHRRRHTIAIGMIRTVTPTKYNVRRFAGAVIILLALSAMVNCKYVIEFMLAAAAKIGSVLFKDTKSNVVNCKDNSDAKYRFAKNDKQHYSRVPFTRL